MSFMVWITTRLASARDYLLSAYETVRKWAWPFYLLATPLYYLYLAFYNLVYHFYDFNTWLVWAADRIGKILDISAITSYFQTWITYATNAWNWVNDHFNQVVADVSTWWNSTQATVLYWIEIAKQWALAQINNLASTLAPVLTWWNSFKANLPTLSEILLWFTNWWANVLSHLSSWWNERLLDIKSLLISWTLDLAPFWAGWQEIRDDVYTFFTAPLDWLATQFEDWFWGKEEE